VIDVVYLKARYRDLLIRYKTDEKRNQKERDDLSKEVKRFEDMVKELKTTATLKEDEVCKTYTLEFLETSKAVLFKLSFFLQITRLKDSISYMKTKEELNRLPKNCVSGPSWKL
jgi:hypothetical protein